MAYLDHDRDSGRIGGESWITGRGLDAVSLWVRRVESDGLARNVAVGHAAWPTWSEDGKTLLFISHDPRTGGGLGLHDLETGITRRISAGLNRMFAPGISPSGRYVAVSGYGAHADDAVLFLIDLTTGRAEPGPVPVLGGAQLRRIWQADDTLIYVELDASGGGGLMRWVLGQSTSRRVSELSLPNSVFDAIHLQAGMAGPLSPSQRWYAYYAVQEQQLEWVGLNESRRVELKPESVAGAWWSEEWFVAADDRSIRMIAVPGPDDTGADAGASAVISADTLPQMTLLPGRWVPVWADAEAKSMLLIGESDQPDRFRFLQLWLKTKD